MHTWDPHLKGLRSTSLLWALGQAKRILKLGLVPVSRGGMLNTLRQTFSGNHCVPLRHLFPCSPGTVGLSWLTLSLAQAAFVTLLRALHLTLSPNEAAGQGQARELPAP